MFAYRGLPTSCENSQVGVSLKFLSMGSKSDQVDPVCDREHSERYDKNDRVIKGVVQHLTNMGPRGSG